MKKPDRIGKFDLFMTSGCQGVYRNLGNRARIFTEFLSTGSASGILLRIADFLEAGYCVNDYLQEQSMDESATAATTLTEKDEEQLRLLGIFHFVYAGFLVLALLFLLLHGSLMVFVFSSVPNAPPGQTTPNGPPPQFLLGFFGVFYGCFGMLIICKMIANILSGRFLRAHRKRVFSLVVAGINCMFVPFGTLLGVFTIVLLTRDTVREGFKD